MAFSFVMRAVGTVPTFPSGFAESTSLKTKLPVEEPRFTHLIYLLTDF